MNGNTLSITSTTPGSASFSGTLQGEGTLDISGKVTQEMRTGSTAYDLNVHDGGTLVLKGTEASARLDYRNVAVGSSGILRKPPAQAAETPIRP